MWNSHYALSLVTAATTEPVTVEDFMAHHRAVAEEEKPLVDAYLLAARKFCESYTRRAFITQTWRLSLDDFPCGTIHVPWPKLVSVSSITYIATDGTSTTLSSSAYTVDTYTEPGRISEAYGYVWPSTRTQDNAVTIQYVAGYGAASAVPATIKTAIKMIASDLYMHRGDESPDEIDVRKIPLGALALLNSECWGSYV